MKKNNKTNSIVGSVITLIIIILVGIWEVNKQEIYTSQASNENVEIINNLEITTGNSCISKIPDDDYLRVYCLDVGQGDSILISNQGKTMLIDASTNEMGSRVVKYLQDLGISKIDYLVGTHPHEDHIGGLDDVIKNFDIGTIYMPKKSANTKTFEDVLNAIKSKNLKVTAPSIGTTFNVGNANCEIMSINNNADNANESSIVIQMNFNGTKYLFTGDANYNVEKSREWNDVDVLKVGHHGSSTSSTKEFLAQVKPEIALISVGKDNTYGHPTESALERLKNIGAKIYRTDEDETIMILEK